MRLMILVAVLVWALPVSAQTALTLEDALALARANRPELTAADARVDAARAAGEQAGAWLNPTGFLRLEAAPRDGDAWDGSERIVGLSQVLPLGGRVGAARRAAEAVTVRRGFERDALRKTVEASVLVAFAEAVHARDELALRRTGVEIATRLLGGVAVRVEHGDAPASDRRRANMEAGVAEAELAAAVAGDEAARVSLAAAIGDVATPVTAVSDDRTSGDPPDLALLLADLDTMPLVRAAASRVEESEALASGAARTRIPDLELEAGLRTSPAGDSFDMGFRVNLPLFDRGGARLSSAQAGARAEAALARMARRDLEAGLRRAHAKLVAAELGAEIYGETVVPEAGAALRSAEAAYTAGDTALTEVLLVRRDWIDASLAHIALRRDSALARAELHALR
jgi:cobalt-zinc-cadmium efflux system outer membrane protein